uniref:SRCR domain-containing protein n=1 Tax=Panagrellus redivivus TaxID=6233 RepID=A0A7E4VD53_PANRE
MRRHKLPFLVFIEVAIFAAVFIEFPPLWPTIAAAQFIAEPVVPVRNPGQMPLPPGIEVPHQRIKNTIGGVYSQNVTLYFRNSPYRVASELIVEEGATITIETGVQIYFDTGVGLKVWGTIHAVGNEFAHIEMLPFQQQLNYDESFPEFKLVDGPTVRQGRLQVKFRDRWRGVCTQLTNWTSIDTGVACRSMGYSDGSFYRWYRRNNDTYPFVMPKPDCLPTARNLWDCEGFSKSDNIPLSENLCQGEDDLGLYCWGRPTFTGWAKHWKGLQIYSSPYHYVHDDPDYVSVARESNSRLEFIDILYAGYDGQTKNVTPALYIEGVPPLMNGLRIQRSARDGIFLYQPTGPIVIANSTISHNRGHGISIYNTTDGRAFINMTRIETNYGNGIFYQQRQAGINLVRSLGNRAKRQSSYYEEEKPRLDACLMHEIPPNLFFPHMIRMLLRNGTIVDPQMPPNCWLMISLPRRLPYTYTVQFLGVSNFNPEHLQTKSDLIICDGKPRENVCDEERYRIPIKDGVFPQSVSFRSAGNPIYLALEHDLGTFPTGRVYGDVDLLFKVYASVEHKAFYGLNVTNSHIANNSNHGIEALMIRERTGLSNVTVDENQGIGFYVHDGAADIWVNDTSMSYNWVDGMNVSYAGGSININGSRFIENRWRGFAFHANTSIPFMALRQEIIIKGRPANNIFYLPTIFKGNFWGGAVIGNYCIPDEGGFKDGGFAPKVFVNWVQFIQNTHHPALEVFSCQQYGVRQSTVDITGNVFESNTEVALRIQPAVNLAATINSNQFLNNNYSALLIRNADHPELSNCPAEVTIAKNSFKFNSGPFIVAIGLNEDAPQQKMIFNQQNEIRENYVYNPFPGLKPRSTPYAAMVVSSSNIKIARNCFNNPKAEYEIGTELGEHAKIIDARENNWGYSKPENFMHRIFDQFNRYSLATIDINPFAAVCNQRNPHITYTQEYYRTFRNDRQPFVIGGTIYENYDLTASKYTVIDDLHVVPGAKLSIAPGTVLEFMNGVGMLVQGELIRSDFTDSPLPVTFTSKINDVPRRDNIRLVDENGNDDVLEGRLEVLIDNQWGTVCNRSWTAPMAKLACHQLGLAIDPQYFENWRTFVSQGDLPMLMDNIRCEENEVDLTRCRHDGVFHNVAAGCDPIAVVGLRCAVPYWAGVRYSLLANPPTVTGQITMNNWLIEKAGLYDFRKSIFAPALQIDWNYHSFSNITVRNNFYEGIDIIYNDLTKKPALRNVLITKNRGNGLRLRSMGITIEDVVIEQNENAGVRFDPQISKAQQSDIVTWLDRREQPDLEANNVFHIPNSSVSRLEVFESQLNQRKFIVAKANSECPSVLYEPCDYSIELYSTGHEYGLSAKMAVQIVNRPNPNGDEDAILVDAEAGKQWSVRKNTIQFPIVSAGKRLTLRYTRSVGDPKLILLVLFLDAQEYLDRFVHVYESVIQDNQYGVSAVHYSNLTFADGTVLNRHTNEKLWFQKVNFTRNSDAVVWINSPQHDVLPDTPIAEITWHIDNCSVHHNTGPIIDTHRDLFASANVFHWNFWSNTFANNTRSGVHVLLPDTYNLLARQEHSFLMTENRFQANRDFEVELGGYFTFANISSNNFTDNFAANDFGIMSLRGMEKRLILEHNRFYNNWGHWLVKMDISSSSLRFGGDHVPAYIQYNYFERNFFITKVEDYVDTWPRSFAVGVFGAQKADVHFNRLSNALMDFEVVAGCTPHLPGFDSMNITFNWWGPNSDGAIPQRIFDMDDRNSYTIGDYSPYFSSRERFNDYWWDWKYAQLSHASYDEPSPHDLHGRMYQSKNLTLEPEQWYKFPFFYRPFRPYRITRDLTIMPGATLFIEKNVEVHVYPNVRILVLGDLIADATLWQPIRFLPVNATEILIEKSMMESRNKRSVVKRQRHRAFSAEYLHMEYVRKKRRSGFDPVFKQFPVLRRDWPFFQTFDVSLTANGTMPGRSGFLQIYNATSGETVPSCDQQFTRRNAQVVCKELGYPTQNVYHWLTPRWDYNPRTRLVKTYMEPRECIGTESRLDQCNLRLTGNDSMWMCMDNEHFNYVHCGSNTSLSEDFYGHWGGIAFSQETLEMDTGAGRDSSMLRHVEIVGGGQVHNDSFQAAALQIIRRNPILENTNVTNSSMHGIQIISPRDSIILTRLNVSDNKGQGLSILTANLRAANDRSPIPNEPMNIPYHAPGLLDICSAGKTLHIRNRIIVYYKYDSVPVDCIKVFTSSTRKLGFRFLQANLYGATNGVGRSDALSIFSDASFTPASLIQRYTSTSNFAQTVLPIQSSNLAMHMRGTAADGDYGFIAEVSVLPTTPDARSVEEVSLLNSRMINNDRGAFAYQSTGEVGPRVIIEQCSVINNGYFLYGNISTSTQAMELHLHNTLMMLFRANALWHNRGGLLVSAQSSSAVAQLNIVIKNSAFTSNSNSTTLAFLGNNYQKVSLLNNAIARNYALYFDTCLVHGMSTNFTRNLITNNTGLNIVDTFGYSRVSSDSQIFEHNYFENNLALGHELQYAEGFGYQPARVEEFDLRPRWKRDVTFEPDNPTGKRVKRQVLSQNGISYDWWTHVGADTGRYRSTVLAGSSHQKFHNNVFNNPLNPFELTTSLQTQFDSGAIDAKDNYWGYPGTQGVASGKIRDQGDFSYLIKVDYVPVLDSNTSLIEGDCPAGWFQAGVEEFKSCFLFVGAALTYEHALQFCEEMDAFLPILRDDDPRQKEIAARIDDFAQRYVADAERYHSFGGIYDIPVWISSVTIPSNQCGHMSSKTSSIGEQNCNNLLPFVCEKGTKPYSEPVLWRRDIILFVVLVAVLLLLLAVLIIGWCVKSKRRSDDHVHKQHYIRESMRRQKEHPRIFSNEQPFADGKGSLFVNPDKVKRLPSKPKPTFAHPPASTITLSTATASTSASGSSRSTASTDTYTKTAVDSFSTDEYTATSYTGAGTLPVRNLVSSTPNPYSEISTFRGIRQQPKLGSRRDTDLSVTTESSCSTCSGIYSLQTCTCACESVATDRASTITEESSTYTSGSSSRSSGSTITQRPLLGRNVVSGGLDRSGRQPSIGTLRVSSRPDLSTNRSAGDFFRGSGRTLTPSRSNPAIYQPPIPASIPRVPSESPIVETYDREPAAARRPRPISGLNQTGHVPVYLPNPELQHVFGHSSRTLSAATSHSALSSPRQVPSVSPGRPRYPPPASPTDLRAAMNTFNMPQRSASRSSLHGMVNALETSM